MYHQKVEAFLKKETNQSSETTQLLTETDASETADMQSTESDDRDRSTACDELQARCMRMIAILRWLSLGILL